MHYLLSGYILYSPMHIILYLMLSLNAIMATIAYMNGDQTGLSHAILFGTVCAVGVGAAWLRDRQAESKKGSSNS